MDKVDAYGLLQRIRREFVEAELPLVGYRECPEGKCALIVWPQENLPPLRRSSLGMLMGVPKPGDGGLEMALGGLDECREVCLGGLARVSRNLHW
ncbi:MAG: hypothetical protein M1531_09100 [Chloroflexi bacterium]|nr:hypothetical protein [Chloroflexota bacterium]